MPAGRRDTFPQELEARIAPSMTFGQTRLLSHRNGQDDRDGKPLREIYSMYGRRILLDNPKLRELRGAFLNYPIQSSAADLLKLTMRRLWQEGLNPCQRA